MASPTLEFWFEFASTYSHIAVHRVRSLLEGTGVALEWRPFLLGPLFSEQGWNDSPFNLYPVKGAYMWRDMERLAEQHEIPFRRPSQFPRGGLLAARVCTAGAGEPWVGDFIRGVYRANFAEDRDISEFGTVRSVLQAAGAAQPDSILERAVSPEVKARLKDRTAVARSIGIFGAPSFVVGQELFWGQDRLGDAIAWARRSST